MHDVACEFVCAVRMQLLVAWLSLSIPVNVKLTSDNSLWSHLAKSTLDRFKVKLTSLSSRVAVKSTFDRFWSEINIFDLTGCRQINIWLFLKWSWTSLSLYVDMKSVFHCFWCDIFIFELNTHADMKSIFNLLFLMWNQLFWAICMLMWNPHLCKLILLWNHHLTIFEVKSTSLSLCVDIKVTSCCFWTSYALTWYQHFAVFDVKWTSLTLWVDIKSTFDCFRSEVNIFELIRWHEINISLFLLIFIFELTLYMHVDMKSIFCSFWCEISIYLFICM